MYSKIKFPVHPVFTTNCSGRPREGRNRVFKLNVPQYADLLRNECVSVCVCVGGGGGNSTTLHESAAIQCRSVVLQDGG